MAARHGSLGEFDQSKGDWTSYIERAKQYFTRYRRRSETTGVLLSAVGDSTYRTIKDVLSPQAPGEASIKSIIDKMTKHYQPAPSEIVQRFRFNTRLRRPHETVATYITQLKQLAEHCNFGNGDRLNKMLRDRLVCGIANEKWQQRLLSEEKLPYEKARKLLLSLEAAEKEVKDLSVGEKVVNQVHARQTRNLPPARNSREQSCHRCGGSHAVRPSASVTGRRKMSISTS